MSDIKISTYITSIVIFTMMILGVIYFVTMFRASDPTFIDDDTFSAFNDTFNTMEDVSSSVGDLQSGIVDSDTDFGVFGVLNALIGSMWNSLTLIFSSFGFMDAVFDGLSTFFGVPTWVPALISLLVVILIAFGIYSLISGNNA